METPGWRRSTSAGNFKTSELRTWNIDGHQPSASSPSGQEADFGCNPLPLFIQSKQ